MVQQPNQSSKSLINERFEYAGIALIGIREGKLRHSKEELFNGNDKSGTVLFVQSRYKKTSIDFLLLDFSEGIIAR